MFWLGCRNVGRCPRTDLSLLTTIIFGSFCRFSNCDRYPVNTAILLAGFLFAFSCFTRLSTISTCAALQPLPFGIVWCLPSTWMEFENEFKMRSIIDEPTLLLSYLNAEASARHCRALLPLSLMWHYCGSNHFSMPKFSLEFFLPAVVSGMLRRECLRKGPGRSTMFNRYVVSVSVLTRFPILHAV